MTGKSATRHRTTERYRAAQGKNDYTNLPHDLAARPAGKFQFVSVLTKPITLLSIIFPIFIREINIVWKTRKLSMSIRSWV